MPPTVKWFAALLYREEARLEISWILMERAWGKVDFLSSPLPFDVTPYYEKEMGTPLFRRIASFEGPADASQLAIRKSAAAEKFALGEVPSGSWHSFRPPFEGLRASSQGGSTPGCSRIRGQ